MLFLLYNTPISVAHDSVALSLSFLSLWSAPFLTFPLSIPLRTLHPAIYDNEPIQSTHPPTLRPLYALSYVHSVFYRFLLVLLSFQLLLFPCNFLISF